MHTPSDKEIMDSYKKDDITMWLDITRSHVTDLVNEYNKVAVENSENLLGLFSMTAVEYKEVFTDAEDENSDS